MRIAVCVLIAAGLMFSGCFHTASFDSDDVEVQLRVSDGVVRVDAEGSARTEIAMTVTNHTAKSPDVDLVLRLRETPSVSGVEFDDLPVALGSRETRTVRYLWEQDRLLKEVGGSEVQLIAELYQVLEGSDDFLVRSQPVVVRYVVQ